MKIFEENGKIRLQLMNMVTNNMLFDFIVNKEEYNDLREHIIEHLNGFEAKE